MKNKGFNSLTENEKKLLYFALELKNSNSAFTQKNLIDKGIKKLELSRDQILSLYSALIRKKYFIKGISFILTFGINLRCLFLGLQCRFC